MKFAIHLMPVQRASSLAPRSANFADNKSCEPTHKFAVTGDLNETVQQVISKAEVHLHDLYGVNTDLTYFSGVKDFDGVDIAMTLRLGEIVSERTPAAERTFKIYQKWLDQKDCLPENSPLRPARLGKRAYEDFTPPEKREYSYIKAAYDREGYTALVRLSGIPAQSQDSSGSAIAVPGSLTPMATPEASSLPPPTSAQRPPRSPEIQIQTQQSTDDELLKLFSSNEEITAELNEEHEKNTNNAFTIMSSQEQPSQASQQTTFQRSSFQQPSSGQPPRKRARLSSTGIKKVCWDEDEDQKILDGFAAKLSAERIRKKHGLNRTASAIRARKILLSAKRPELFRKEAKSSQVAADPAKVVITITEDNINDAEAVRAARNKADESDHEEFYVDIDELVLDHPRPVQPLSAKVENELEVDAHEAILYEDYTLDGFRDDLDVDEDEHDSGPAMAIAKHCPARKANTGASQNETRKNVVVREQTSRFSSLDLELLAAVPDDFDDYSEHEVLIAEPKTKIPEQKCSIDRDVPVAAKPEDMPKHHELELRRQLMRFLRADMTHDKIAATVHRVFRHASDDLIEWHIEFMELKRDMLNYSEDSSKWKALKQEMDHMIYFRDVRRPDYWADDSLMPEEGGAVIVPRTEPWVVVPRGGTGAILGNAADFGLEIGDGGVVEDAAEEVTGGSGGSGAGSVHDVNGSGPVRDGVNFGRTLQRSGSCPNLYGRDGKLRSRRARRHARRSARRRASKIGSEQLYSVP